LTKLINKATLSKSDNELLSCYAFIQEEGFCLRTNNLTIFAETNRQIMGKIMPFYQRERTISLTGKSNQVNLDSLIGEGSKIGEKALVKRSVIGKNCVIGEKSKITNSIIMDNVKISDGVIIQGSIDAPQNGLSKYSLYTGFAHLAAGLCCGLSGLAAGMAIGIVGDAGVRAVGQQEKLFVGMILILIFAEALGLYGLIVALILSQNSFVCEGNN